MKKKFDFGIDLGTTNSAISRIKNGDVEVLKNPIGHKETLPSVVAFRKGRIMVGDKAREYLEKDSKNVAGLFKRKMGTSDMIPIESLGKSLSPTELSSYVLKELKNFIYDDTAADAVIITIPASFDTIQSNATQEAGKLAGFKEVRLLQEPVAAALAFVNRTIDDEDAEGKWLVFDYGGGTFDAAIIHLEDGEMNVIDHEGDNYLGGLDFDNAIVEKIIIPKLMELGTFNGDLKKEMKSASGKYNALYYLLLKKAEEAKVQLSNNDTAEIEFEIEDDAGEDLDVYFDITRAQFDEAIVDKVNRAVGFVKKLIEKNKLTTQEIKSILMIGGSTYVPLVRKILADETAIPVDYSVDPTTAVTIGAAFYASTQQYEESIVENEASVSSDSKLLVVKTAYQKSTQSQTEYFTAVIDENIDGLFYRIIRKDGGFDSGLKPLSARIEEFLPLLSGLTNPFSFTVYDGQNNEVPSTAGLIEITQGQFAVLGQTLPNDICLELDDIDEKSTKLEVIFEKNALLPVRKTITKQINKTLHANSLDGFFINILEGPQHASPASNKPIGVIEVKGQKLTRDLLKNTDIEIKIEMDQSRELKVTVYVVMTDQEFKASFSPSERYVSISKLSDEVHELMLNIRDEINYNESEELYDVAAKFKDLENETVNLYSDVMDLTEDDVTDAKFQIEDAKRKIALTVDELTKNKKLSGVLKEYFDAKKWCESSVIEYGSDSDKASFQNIIGQEKAMISAGNKGKIRSVTEQIHEFRHRLNWKKPDYVMNIFFYYKFKENYSDKVRADKLKEQGDVAIEKERFDELRSIVSMLHQLLPPEDQETSEFKGTGLS